MRFRVSACTRTCPSRTHALGSFVSLGRACVPLFMRYAFTVAQLLKRTQLFSNHARRRTRRGQSRHNNHSAPPRLSCYVHTCKQMMPCHGGCNADTAASAHARQRPRPAEAACEDAPMSQARAPHDTPSPQPLPHAHAAARVDSCCPRAWPQHRRVCSQLLPSVCTQSSARLSSQLLRPCAPRAVRVSRHSCCPVCTR